MNITDPYIRMLILAAQIDVLKDLPTTTVVRVTDSLDGMLQKSAVLMDDVINTMNEKRRELQVLNKSDEIRKLKDINTKLQNRITELEKDEDTK